MLMYNENTQTSPFLREGSVAIYHPDDSKQYFNLLLNYIFLFESHLNCSFIETSFGYSI